VLAQLLQMLFCPGQQERFFVVVSNKRDSLLFGQGRGHSKELEAEPY
jgi:hypothetical protein